MRDKLTADEVALEVVGHAEALAADTAGVSVLAHVPGATRLVQRDLRSCESESTS